MLPGSAWTKAGSPNSSPHLRVRQILRNCAFRRIRKIPEDFHQRRSSERRPRERRTLKVRKTLPGYSSPTDRAILKLKLN